MLFHRELKQFTDTKSANLLISRFKKIVQKVICLALFFAHFSSSIPCVRSFLFSNKIRSNNPLSLVVNYAVITVLSLLKFFRFARQLQERSGQVCIHDLTKRKCVASSQPLLQHQRSTLSHTVFVTTFTKTSNLVPVQGEVKNIFNIVFFSVGVQRKPKDWGKCFFLRWGGHSHFFLIELWN